MSGHHRNYNVGTKATGSTLSLLKLLRRRSTSASDAGPSPPTYAGGAKGHSLVWLHASKHAQKPKYHLPEIILINGQPKGKET